MVIHLMIPGTYIHIKLDRYEVRLRLVRTHWVYR